jgi:hypothetical protein
MFKFPKDLVLRNDKLVKRSHKGFDGVDSRVAAVAVAAAGVLTCGAFIAWNFQLYSIPKVVHITIVGADNEETVFIYSSANKGACDKHEFRNSLRELYFKSIVSSLSFPPILAFDRFYGI